MPRFRHTSISVYSLEDKPAKKRISLLLAVVMLLSMCACSKTDTSDAVESAAVEESAPVEENAPVENIGEEVPEETPEAEETEPVEEPEPEEEVEAPVADAENKALIEDTLNLANNEEQTWTYNEKYDAWVLSVVSAVVYPEIPEKQGVSVCVPGAYVTGIDTDGDKAADVMAADAAEGVKGGLVIDYEAEITNVNGQTYTASTAPVVINTGAAGYGSQKSYAASGARAAYGYINVSCGNRGKQDSVTDANGVVTYTGDAPSCLVDQKAAARYVKYNILLGNLPGSVDHFVSTGGSGGAAHASMFAATGNNPAFYDYLAEAGAVGVYKTEDGGYSTTVTIDDVDYKLSDGAWGSIAYSTISSLYEADMALGFEYYLNADYSFKTAFQKQLAQYLSESYMEYINSQALSVDEAAAGFDLDGDGQLNSVIDLTIEHDIDAYPETNGYYGTYLDLYLAEFTENLQWYIDNLDYAEGWTWFDENGAAVSDLAGFDKATAFIEGRYAKATSGMGGPGGPPGGPGGPGGPVGTPGAGTSQSASGAGTDSRNYSSYEEMVAEYKADIEEVYAGDRFGKNTVELYNPVQYIGADGTDDPVWTKIIMGGSEGDISMFNSLNLRIAWLNAGTDAELQWQWNGGHVPSEIFGDSFSLYLDQMYGKYVEGANAIEKPAVAAQANGTAEEMTGTDISDWISYDGETVSFALADIAAYRTKSAAKAMPAFDVIDYGQEDYVFGSSEKNARHWNKYLLEIFEEHSDTLAPLFNGAGN